MNKIDWDALMKAVKENKSNNESKENTLNDFILNTDYYIESNNQPYLIEIKKYSNENAENRSANKEDHYAILKRTKEYLKRFKSFEYDTDEVRKISVNAFDFLESHINRIYNSCFLQVLFA